MKILHTGPFGVNTLIVPLCDDYCFIVDPACCEFCQDDTVILDYLSENNLKPAAILLTHGHFDHIAGTKILKNVFPQIPVLIHQADSDHIGSKGNIIQARDLSLMGFEDFIPSVSDLPEADGFLADDKTVAQCYDFKVPQKVVEMLNQWIVYHTPGHTPGGTCFYNKQTEELISGDTMFYGSWGRTDLTGGNEADIVKSLKKLVDLTTEDTLVYPGHERTGFKISINYQIFVSSFLQFMGSTTKD